jgi:predicted permease
MWLRAVFRPRDTDRDMAREMTQHLALEEERLQRSGLAPGEAHRQALLAFGGVERYKEAVRDERATRFLGEFAGDLRYAVRRLRRTPGLSGVIIATLAIVIGANTAIFGLVNALFLRQLPLPHASELVAVRPMSGGGNVTVTWPAFQQLRRAAGVPPMAGYFFEPLRAGTNGTGELVWGDVVSGEYFRLLGVRPMLGRLIGPGDESAAAPVAVVSAAFWRAHLGADSSLVGRPIRINGSQFTLIGVTAPAFAGLYLAHEFTVAVPITAPGIISISSLAEHYLDIVARLDHGVGRTHAAFSIQNAFLGCCLHLDTSASSGAIADDSRPTATPDDGPTGDTQYGSADKRWHIELPTASHGLTWSTDYRSEFGRVLLALVAGVLVLTLIACANIATLLLARATSRAGELSVRASLGASRSRLVRQLLAESLTLGLSGAVLGVALAEMATVELVRNLPRSLGRLHDAISWHIDPTILLFTAGVTIGCTLFFGLWPARRATRADLLTALKGRRPGSVSARAWNADRVLVVGQLALALMLIASAALAIATLRNLGRTSNTYGDRHVVLANIQPREWSPDTSLKALHDPIITAIASIPGVTSVAAAATAPIYSELSMWTTLRLPAFADAKGRGPSVRIDPVDPNFFSATAVRIVRGRPFIAGDLAGAAPVAVVSESFARHYFGARDPIGETLTFLGDSTRPARIVGVAKDAKYDDVRNQPAEMLYLPLAQSWKRISSFSLVIRVLGAPTAMAPLIQQRISAAAPDVGVRDVTALDDLLANMLARERLIATLGFAFGLVALGLSAIGLYGLVAFQTLQRTREIGVRMALGAAPGDAVRLVIRETIALALVGVAVGVPLAFGVARAARSAVYGIDSGDPRILLGSAVLLMLAAIGAGVLPARRAARIDPVIALRSE